MSSMEDGLWCDWCAKKIYRTKSDAYKAISKMKGNAYRYSCRFGNGYHLTRRKPFD